MSLAVRSVGCTCRWLYMSLATLCIPLAIPILACTYPPHRIKLIAPHKTQEMPYAAQEKKNRYQTRHSASQNSKPQPQTNKSRTDAWMQQKSQPTDDSDPPIQLNSQPLPRLDTTRLNTTSLPVILYNAIQSTGLRPITAGRDQQRRSCWV